MPDLALIQQRFVALNISQVDKLIELKKHTKVHKKFINIAKEKFTLITSGSLEKEKNFQLILDALSRLDNDNYNLIILGDGPFKENLKIIVDRKKLTNVYFIGKVPWKEIFHYYDIADLFILPGRGGMVISECMACGLPVLLKAADGIERDLVIDKQTGFYFQENNPDSLAKEIFKISQNKSLLDKVSKNAYNLIRDNHGIKKFAESFELAILKTMGEDN